MPRISHHWYRYYLGCVMGGLLLGLTYIYLQPTGRLRDEQVSPMVNAPIPLPTPTPMPKALTTIIFTGDVMLGRSVNKNIQDNHNPSWPFTYVQDVLRSADITYINLENPLISDCPVVDSGMKFCGDITSVQGLVGAGIDVASLANNHATNYGQSGLEETVASLTIHDISPVGTGPAITLKRYGRDYTFLSYNDVSRYSGIAQADMLTLPDQVRAAKTANNLLIVTFHWGAEYQSTPTSRQVTLARLAIDSGADLVIGAHPHWVQTKEVYKDKPIYYSLGNFVFDQEWSPETKKGLAVRFTYDGSTLVKTEELPLYIDNYGQPHWQ